MSTDIHSCSYYCDHPKCIERQRDELRDKFFVQWELKERVNDLFTKYLDVQEESDSGRLFNPISISCCRAMKLKPLGELINRLRELSK